MLIEATVLLLAAIATLVVRYRGRSSRLLQVIRRDGGVYYLALAGKSCLHLSYAGADAGEVIRLGSAIVSTPGVMKVRVSNHPQVPLSEKRYTQPGQSDGNPGIMYVHVTSLPSAD